MATVHPFPSDNATPTDPPALEQPKPPKGKAAHFLPSDRIGFAKQLEILRAYASSSEGGGKTVTNKDVAAILGMSESTIGLLNPFFVESGFLTKTEAGVFSVAADVVNFGRAHQWNPDTAPAKLGPIVQQTWYANIILVKARVRGLDEADAIQDLALAAKVDKDYRAQLRLLLDYLTEARIIERDGSTIRPSAPVAATPATPEVPAAVPPDRGSRAPLVSTAFAQDTEGVVQFHVTVRVTMSEFAGWKPERITAFFGGIAQVLAAKGTIEEDASSS